VFQPARNGKPKGVAVTRRGEKKIGVEAGCPGGRGFKKLSLAGGGVGGGVGCGVVGLPKPSDLLRTLGKRFWEKKKLPLNSVQGFRDGRSLVNLFPKAPGRIVEAPLALGRGALNERVSESASQKQKARRGSVVADRWVSLPTIGGHPNKKKN